ncbi:transposase, IS481 family [Bordetella pertussis H918]|nr:transposase, IS481 family [Bordetella pertussis H918]
MNTHKHARLTFLRRLEMVQQLIAHQVCVPEAARAYGVTAPTVRKWLGRFLAQGQAGLACVLAPDGLAPSDCAGQGAGYRGAAPQAADPSAHRQALGVSASTVSRVLARAGLSPWPPGAGAGGALRASGPGDLLHIDIKKLGRIQRPGTGSRATDAIPLRGPAGTSSSWPSMTTPGGLHRHPPDERFPSAVQFLKDAVAYQRLGVTSSACSPTMARPFAAAPSPRCAMSWASSTALPDLTAHRPMARPNASSSRPCVSGLTLTPTRTPNTEPMP